MISAKAPVSGRRCYTAGQAAGRGLSKSPAVA